MEGRGVSPELGGDVETIKFVAGSAQSAGCTCLL